MTIVRQLFYFSFSFSFNIETLSFKIWNKFSYVKLTHQEPTEKKYKKTNNSEKLSGLYFELKMKKRKKKERENFSKTVDHPLSQVHQVISYNYLQKEKNFPPAA